MGTSDVLASGRRAAEALMTDVCTVSRPTGVPVLDNATQQYTGTTTQVYTGRCQVQTRALVSGERDQGDALTLINRAVVKLPISATGFASGDSVVIDAAGDAQLVGAKFTVRSVDDKSHATCRRLEVEET